MQIRWFNVAFVPEPFLRTLHFIGNHRRPLVMRDLSERLVSDRKEHRGGGGGGGERPGRGLHTNLVYGLSLIFVLSSPLDLLVEWRGVKKKLPQVVTKESV